MSVYLRIMLIVLVTSAITPGVAAATPQEMAVVINLAGKQRMLTQKMSKEVFLIALDIDVEANTKNLHNTSALFDKTLKGLLHGDKDLGLVGTTDPKIVHQLKRVDGLWISFKTNIDAVLGGDKSGPVLEKIAKENLPLLTEMNKAVKMYEQSL